MEHHGTSPIRLKMEHAQLTPRKLPPKETSKTKTNSHYTIFINIDTHICIYVCIYIYINVVFYYIISICLHLSIRYYCVFLLEDPS